MNAGPEAERIVQRQLDAYNARDIDAFMAVWADDARCFAHPSTLLAHGAAEIRARHAARFKEANLHARLLHRMSIGNTVIDREVVTRTFPEGPGTIDVIAIYNVTDGKIASAWFVFGTPVPEKAERSGSCEGRSPLPSEKEGPTRASAWEDEGLPLRLISACRHWCDG